MGLLKDWFEGWKLEREASLEESVANRLNKEFPNCTGGRSHELKISAHNKRTEAKILFGEIKPVNKKYID